MPQTDALSTERVLDVAAAALRDTYPSLKSSYEAVAVIGHACMAAVDFRLVGLGEDHNLGSFPKDSHSIMLANAGQRHPQKPPPSPQNGMLTVPLLSVMHMNSLPCNTC